jgi:hypothetical protein
MRKSVLIVLALLMLLIVTPACQKTPAEFRLGSLEISPQKAAPGEMVTIFFTEKPVTDYETAARADTKLYAKFFHEMLSQGIYLPPS